MLYFAGAKEAHHVRLGMMFSLRKKITNTQNPIQFGDVSLSMIINL